MNLDENYNDYQEIVITDKKIIKDFIETHIKIWQEDIIKFDDFKIFLNIDKIKSLDFYSYIGIKEELEYQFVYQDDTVKNFYLDKDIIVNWLMKHNLIIRGKIRKY